MVTPGPVRGTLISLRTPETPPRDVMFLNGTVQLIDDDGTDFHGKNGPNGYVDQTLSFIPAQPPNGWEDIDGVSYSLSLVALDNHAHAVWAAWEVKIGFFHPNNPNIIWEPTESPSSGFIRLLCRVVCSDIDGFMPFIGYQAVAVGRLRLSP
jgi:hypothetical protein